MRNFVLLLVILLYLSPVAEGQELGKKKSLFDGKTFNGWDGDLGGIWKIEDHALVGGSLTTTVAHNEFIRTKAEYSDYVLSLKFKLTGHEGFINGGVQFHSQPASDPAYEMVGYQADIGEGFWASLYDESRRNKLLVTADPELVRQLLRPNDWNDYVVRTEGSHIQIFLNGKKTVDYLEEDPSIPQSGHIAFQIHGGGKAKVFYKDIFLQKIIKKIN